MRGDRLCGNYVQKIEFPFPRDGIAKLVRFREVVAGFEEEHRNFRDPLAEKMQDDHVFGLKAAGEACTNCEGLSERRIHDFFGWSKFERFQIVRKAH